MIRNNQNGRRRGRGGARPPQAGGGPSGNYGNANGGGSRIDTRQRGNATQLLEKYKAMARDATQNGDRVQAEFYMQYADHYYRVVNEFRARDPQPAQRPTYDDDDGYGAPGSNYAPESDGRFTDDGTDNDGDRRDVAAGHARANGSDDRVPYEGAGRDARARDDRGSYDNASRDQRLRDDRPAYDGPNRDQRQRDERPAVDGATREQGRARDDRSGDARRTPDRQSDDAPRARTPGETAGGERSRPINGERVPRFEARERPEPAATISEPEESGMIAGLPGPATLAAPAVVPDGDEPPAPRRRGRPRKVVVAEPGNG